METLLIVLMLLLLFIVKITPFQLLLLICFLEVYTGIFIGDYYYIGILAYYVCAKYGWHLIMSGKYPIRINDSKS